MTRTRPAWPSGDSYAQWLRRVLSAARDGDRALCTLFDSSTAEPTALLAEVIERAFTPPISSRYQSVFAGGNKALLTVLAARYRVPAECVLATAGATSALGLVYRAYLSPGERILVETPGFDLFEDVAGAMSVNVDRFARAADGAIEPAAVAAAITPATRLIVLSDLHNPTGQPLARDTLARIAELAAARGVDVLVDEVYREYAEPPHASAVNLAPNIVVINSLTKVFGLSALRCGWIIADATRIKRLHTVHARLEFANSKVTHAAAALILERPDAFEEHWRSLLNAGRPIMQRAFAQWAADGLIEGDVPAHGCIAFPRLVAIDDTIAFGEWLAERTGVIVAPGEYFGAPGHIRIGFSREPDQLARALQAIEDGLRAHMHSGASATLTAGR